MAKSKYQTIISIKQALLGEVKHTITVRKIGGKYHCRVFTNNTLNQEAICYSKRDIAFTCRNLLCTEDKCGNISEFATAARVRLNDSWDYV
jgi:hypothetical protein